MRKILALAFLAGLIPASAEAANRVWVSEFAVIAAANTSGNLSDVQAAQIPSIADSGPIDITAGGSYAVGTKTTLVRVCTEAQMALKGASGATTSNMVMFGSTCEYFGVLPSSTVSFVLNP